MSLFTQQEADCPACGKPVSFALVASVNADRRPDLRAAILDGSFQCEACPACGKVFRLEPEFTYLDVARGQWLLLQPVDRLADWPQLEEQAGNSYALAYGERAAPPAREIGKGLKARVTFGWEALREKLVAAEHGLDDVVLEMLKLRLLRSLPDQPLADGNELRLQAVEGDVLQLAWLAVPSGRPVEVLAVPRELYDGIAKDAAWKPLREQVGGGFFVDLHRVLVPAGAEDPVEADA
ncbi:MAG: hypothetical protein EPO01_13080 [Aquabacterium sp.]|nr:MAG: hypothetical protein EPO01_13080 [Aquabacterium sp.]